MNRNTFNHLAYAAAVTALCLATVGSLGWPEFASAAEKKAEMPRPTTTVPRVEQKFGRLPLHFEPNLGQAHSQAKFLTRGRGYSLLLEPTQAVLALRAPVSKGDNAQGDVVSGGAGEKQAVVRLRFLGAHGAPEITGGDALPGRSNYLLGNDKSKWRTNVPHYASVRYRDLYPGIDLVYYGQQQKLEYDLIVAPGADPNVIRMSFEGVENLSLDVQGNLVLHIASGEVIQQTPVIYQEIAGARHAVAGGYVLHAKNEVGVSLAEYDRRQTLVIDPTLLYSSYLGGSGFDEAHGIAVDSGGNVYVAGQTDSADFPGATGALQNCPSFFSPQLCDIFLTKFDPSGTSIVYTTFLGGSFSDGLGGIAVDVDGNVYLAGGTDSQDFPTANAIQPSCVLRPIGPIVRCGGDAFITKLNAVGDGLVYSTFLGGTGGDHAGAIALDPDRNTYVAGTTTSGDFPTVNALQGANAGGVDFFVAKLNASGTAMVYSTYLGGSSSSFSSGEFSPSIAADAAGNAYVAGGSGNTDFPVANAYQNSCALNANGGCGADAVLTKIGPTGSLLFSTFFGGSSFDWATDVTMDAVGNPYVVGRVDSFDFPTTPGALRANCPNQLLSQCFAPFLAKFSSTGSLIFSTYIASDAGVPTNVGLDGLGNIFVASQGHSPQTPTLNAIQAVGDGAYVAKLNPDATQLIYATLLGGTFVDGLLSMATDAAGNVYAVGVTFSRDFPTRNAVQPNPGGANPPCADQDCTYDNWDGFVFKISPDDNTTAPGTINLVDGVDITFSDVTASGTTSVTTMTNGPTVPSGFSLGDPATFYEISTTATFSGLITICINYTGVNYGIEADLKLYHWRDGVSVPDDVTTSVNTETNIICGQVSSFSPFAILRPPLPPLSVEGLLPPLAALVPEGVVVPFPDRAFKQGKTLPLRFRLFAGAQEITNHEAAAPQVVGLVRVGDAPLDLETLDLDAGQTNDSGLLFRFEEGSWAYNLNTKGLSAGAYVITIRMPDNLRYSAGFALR